MIRHSITILALLGIVSFAPAKADTVLRVAQLSLTRVLDPVFTTSSDTRDFGYLIWDTLLGVDDKYEPKPQMVSGWTVSPDGLTYRFTLRDGLTWHDGTPVTADDCIPSIRRWGARDPMGQKLMSFTKELVRVDDRTFDLVLKEPYGLVLASLGKVGATVPFMMPKRIAETPPSEQIKEFVGSGPFRFVDAEYRPGVKMVFVKNTAYVPRAEPPQMNSGAKLAKVDRLEWIGMPDPMTQINALAANEIDYAPLLPTDLLPIIEKTKGVSVVIPDPGGRQNLLRMNWTQPPFDDVKMRQAVLLAVDQAEYLQAQGGDARYYRTCASYYMCGSPYASDVGAPKRDLARARQLVKESSYDGRPIVILHVTDNPTIKPLGLVTAEILEGLGLKVDLQAMDFSTFTARRASMKPVGEGGWNIGHTGFGLPDLGNPLVSIPLSGAGPSAWWGWPTDAEVERLRDAFTRETDPAKQKQIAIAIQKRAYELVFYVPAGEFVVIGAIRNEWKGLVKGPVYFYWNLEKG